MFKKMKLAGKLLIPIILVSVIGIAALIFIAASQTMKVTTDEAHKIALEMGYRYANESKTVFENALTTVRTLGKTFESFKEEGKPERDVLDKMLKKTLEDNSSFLGTWSVWEPEALDGQDSSFADTKGHDNTGRYIPYFYRSDGEIKLTPLVDYDKPGAGDYYLKAKKTGKETILDPYLYEIEGEEVLLLSIAEPVIVDGRVVGVVGVDFTNEYFFNMVKDIHPFETGYVSIATDKGKYVAHPKRDRLGVQMKGEELSKTLESAKIGSVLSISDYSETSQSSVFRVFVPFELGRTGKKWVVVVNAPKDKIEAASKELSLFMIIIGAVTLTAIVLVIYFLVRSLLKPLKKMTKKVESFGNGDLTIQFMQDGNDEIAQMAGYLMQMADSVRNSIISVNESAKQIGDASNNLSDISEKQSTSVQSLQEEAETVDTNVQNTSASIEEVNSGIEEISASAQDVSKNAQVLSEEVESTEKAVEKGIGILNKQEKHMVAVGKQNKNAMEIVKALAEKSNNVQEIVNTISSIAEQTNLLALNAAIEAARAGEAGKGFAVVADEIRKLAEESQTSSANIAKILNEIDEGANQANDSVQKTVELYKELNEGSRMISEEFNTINAAVESITSRVETLTASAEEQSASSEEIASAMDSSAKAMVEVSEQMDRMNDAVTLQKQNAENIGSASEELNAQAESLIEQVKHFRV